MASKHRSGEVVPGLTSGLKDRPTGWSINGPKPLLTAEVVKKIKEFRKDGLTVPEIIRRIKLSKASIYRALA
jgi:hypothetical protein